MTSLRAAHFLADPRYLMSKSNFIPLDKMHTLLEIQEGLGAGALEESLKEGYK